MIFNVNFTNGVGNNIFQYMFGRIKSERDNCKFSHPTLPVLGIKGNKLKLKNPKKIKVSSNDSKMFHKILNTTYNTDVDFSGYPEEFFLYTDRMDKIREWFPNNSKVDTGNSLCLHLRAGDRLLMKGCFKEENGWPITAEQYIKGIESFDFDKLYIVTDMPVWKEINEEELSNMKFHREVRKDRVELKVGVEYWNSLYNTLKQYNPEVRFGYPVEKDFEFMRKFKKFMFAHGTLAWWAAALGNAEEVAVYGKWRGGKESDLAWANLSGWRHWGDPTAPPRFVKEQNLLRHAKENNIKIFVETGTRKGTTIKEIGNEFDKIYTIELIPEAYKKAKKALSGYKHVTLIQGDSGEKIIDVLKELNQPALFWLDAHDGRNSTPIMTELKNILEISEFPHVLIIDDCRYFGTEEAYPTVDEVKSFVLNKRPNAKVYTRFDSICIQL